MALMTNYFKGEIDGYRAGDFAKMLSPDVNTQLERIKLVYEVVKRGQNFFDEYFDQDRDLRAMWVLTPNTCDPLSDGSPIVKEIEILTNYILYSPDGERMNKKVKYNFYTEKEFRKRCEREFGASINSMEVEEVDYLIRMGQNYKKEMRQEIFQRDFKDPELQCIIPYKNEIERMKILAKEYKESGTEVKKMQMLYRNIKSMTEDMIYLKNIIKSPIVWKSPLADCGEYQWDEFIDWNNKDHIKALLRMPEKPFSTDLGCIIFDLKKLIKKIELNKNEKDILNWHIESDIPQKTISKLLKIAESGIDKTLDRIIEKIIYQYNLEYEDNYFLNIEKGEYIKCSKCGEIKLASDNYFNKDSNNGKLRKICKICSK